MTTTEGYQPDAGLVIISVDPAKTDDDETLTLVLQLVDGVYYVIAEDRTRGRHGLNPQSGYVTKLGK